MLVEQRAFKIYWNFCGFIPLNISACINNSSLSAGSLVTSGGGINFLEGVFLSSAFMLSGGLVRFDDFNGDFGSSELLAFSLVSYLI